MPASLEKSQRIDAGLRRLSSRQRPGETLTPTQIARECGCRDRAIVFIERKAQLRFVSQMQKMYPGLIEQVFNGRPIHELMAQISKDPYRSGRPAVRPKLEVKKPVIREVPLYQLISEVAPARPERNFKRSHANRDLEPNV